MHGLRRFKLLALAAVALVATGCANVPSSPTASDSLPNSTAQASAQPAVAAAPAAASSAEDEVTIQATAPDAAASAPADEDTAVLQAALQASDPADMPPRNYQDIWQRIRAGFAIPDMDGTAMDPNVRQALAWYTARPDYVARTTERARKYLYYIVQEVQRRHMPTELALLPFVESAFNPQALSTAKASGMWQFIPSTGTQYNLKQTMFQDGRRDVMASTRAALDYLSKLHDMFGDWQLALAAYNWGEGGVQRAINHNQARGLPVDYASLNMPAETRNYYPKLQAVKDIIADPAKYGIDLPAVPDHPYFKPVKLTQDVDVAVAARLAGVPLDEFRALNPSYRKPVILAAAHPVILLPYDNATAFEQALDDYPHPLSSWTTYAVRATASPTQIARNLHLAEATLRDVNNIPARTLVKAGSTLLVPKAPQDDRNVSADAVANAVLALAPEHPARRLRVKAGRADTPGTIARRFGVEAADVARWNHVAENGRFRARAMVVVYTEKAPARARRAETQVASRHVRHLSHGGVKVASRTSHAARKPLRYAIRTSAKRGIRVAQR